jgi:hypothetical protein
MVTFAPQLTEIKSEVFYEMPLAMINAGEQIRSGIDTEGEAFLALKTSIAEKGVLVPILVTPRDGRYLLIAGERRLLACQVLGMERIPARVLDALEAKAEILAIQLVENLQREDLDPIDTAQALLSYFQATTGQTNLDALMNLLVLYKIDPRRVDEPLTSTVDTLLKVYGKSATSAKRMLSLLTLPEDIRLAVKNGAIPVSIGYIFAANLDNPGLQKAWASFLEAPMTQAQLEQLLASFVKTPGTTTTPKVKPPPFAGLYLSMRNTKISFTKGRVYPQGDLEKLRDDLKSLTELVEQKIQALAAPDLPDQG